MSHAHRRLAGLLERCQRRHAARRPGRRRRPAPGDRRGRRRARACRCRSTYGRRPTRALAAHQAVVTADEAAPTDAHARRRRALLDGRRPRRRGPRPRPPTSSSGWRAPRPSCTAPTVDEVHFHEVGALDALADVVGCAAGFVHLGLDAVVVSPVALGSGRARTAHGELPVPVPAVLELLRESGLPTTEATAPFEQCTPTGAAVLAAVATGVRADAGDGRDGQVGRRRRHPARSPALPTSSAWWSEPRRSPSAAGPEPAPWSCRRTSTTSTRGSGRSC